MKVTNWRRKLMATLVAGGLLAPSALHAANLDTNLVVDPSFENVDVGTTCCYLNAATKLNSWADGSVTGFAYNYGLNWDDGTPPPASGFYFFGAGGTNSVSNPPPITSPGEVAQNIPVGTGATAAQIAAGQAAVVSSGFFTSYNGQNFHGSIHVEFLNSGGGSLGSTVLTAKQSRPWHEEREAAFVPTGTATLRASLYGDGYNAYIDNVDIRVTDAANELLYLEVNTTNGQVAIKNQSGDTFHIDYYKITSAGNSLDATDWNSLQEQNRPGFPSGNGTGNGWEQFGGSGSGVIGESYLTGNSRVDHGANIGLGAAFNPGGAQDLVFLYGAVPGTGEAVSGDYNNDGSVDAADYVIWRKNDGTPAGYTTWRTNFGASSSPTGTGEFVRGFVKYVTSGPGGGSLIPEPSAIILVSMALGAVALIGGRRSKPGFTG
jgi:hypothetical protein